MDALVDPVVASTPERAQLAAAHHEICTALTVFRSNVELVRNRLRDATPPGASLPIRAHLDEIDGAIERLRGIAHDLKRWHDAASSGPRLVSVDAGNDAASSGPRLVSVDAGNDAASSGPRLVSVDAGNDAASSGPAAGKGAPSGSRETGPHGQA